MAEIEWEGLVIDEESGEIIEGQTDLDALVHKAWDAELQRKRWAQIEQACKAAVLRQQTDRKSAYGRLTATIVTGTYPKLSAGWARAVLEGEIPPEAHADLLARAKSFDTKTLGDVLRGLVENYTDHLAKKPYPLISVATRRAPQARAADDE